jgi:hypothetical protein
MPTISDVYQAIVVYDALALSLVLWDGSISVDRQQAAAATVSSVADTASSTTILAANSNRLGASVYNDSTVVLYLLYGSGTASATNYTAAVYPNGFHPILTHYTGQITGVWASDPDTGAARVTELSA